MNKDYAHTMQDDLISRQDAIDAWWHDEVFFGNQRDNMTKEQWLDYITDIIGSLPSAEPKTGEWVKVIDEETPNVTKWHYECDQCRTGRYENGQRYCHNCGAKMLREDGEEK